MFETLKFIHVLAAIVWVGGGIVSAILSYRMRYAAPEHRLGFARDMAVVGDRIYGSAAGIALIAGIWMVIDEPAFGFGQAWIIIGLAGFALSSAIGVGFFGPATKALIADLEAGGSGDAARARIQLGSYADLAILIVVVWAMVVKPGF